MTQAHPYRDRVAALRRAIADQGAAAMVVSDPMNVRYLSGFTGSNGSLAVLVDRVVLVTDGRYVNQAASEAPDVDVVEGRATDDGALAVMGEADVEAVLIEADHVSWAGHERMARSTTADLIGVSDVVEHLRRHKDPGEVTLITDACEIIDAAVQRLIAAVHPGVTERGLSQQLHRYVFEAGGDDIAFPTIIASGPNSAIPHHEPTDRAVAVGDLLKIDAGALFQGYHSDMTRTFVVAADPTPEQADLHRAVAEAAAAARALVRPGTPVAEADLAARAALAEAGLEERYTHGLGHGVGLRIHEAPMLRRDLTDTIAAGDVLTIEPGAYVPGFGGVRVEDTLVVTDDGAECLTSLPRELIRLG